ncbi:MAG: MBL fold metallo-hydrolase [Syntrophomonadaceae bacterium]|nr:MBL fold metallo-hydrolase [Syntrophomonadaceae bacterium]
MIQLTEHVRVLGNGDFNVYVVGSREAVLVECGTRAGAAIFERQWEQLEDKPDIRYLFAPHSHFDHVGGLPVLKRMFPQAQVVASAAAQKILSKEKIVKDLFAVDAAVTEIYLTHGLLEADPQAQAPETILVDVVVGEGDTLAVDGLQLQFLDAPGHSVCSVAAYLPQDQVLFVSDAAGVITGPREVSPVFFHDYAAYVATLERFATFPVQAVALAHGEIPTGPAAERFLRDSLAAAREGLEYIKRRLGEGASDDQIAGELFERYIQGGLAYYPVDFMTGAMHLLIRSTRAVMEAGQ